MSGFTPESLASIDVGRAYRDLRERVSALVAELDEDGWERTVPHCPDWTIRQTLAHMAGVVDDAINQNMAGVATAAWTQAQVDNRAGRTGPEIIDEWNAYAPFVEAVATQRGMAISQLLFDAATHEHDLRHALATPGHRESTAVAVATGFVARQLAQLPGGSPVRIVIDGSEVSGDETADTPVLTATAFDVIRCFGSRRSRAQVEALDWTVLDCAVLDELTFFGYPGIAINE